MNSPPVDRLTAIERVLEEEGTPLHYREITRRVLSRGYWRTDGRTPEATVSARLSVDAKRAGAASRVIRLGKGIVTLRAWNATEPRNDSVKPLPSLLNTDDQLVDPMSFTDAAEHVLRQFGHRRSMHYRDITAKGVELGFIRTQGQTPEATMSAQIGVEIHRQNRRGVVPRFVRHGKGLIGLSEWMSHGLADQIEQNNAAVRKRLHARLHAMDPSEFESLIGQLLGAVGFAEVTVTNSSGDGGIDVRGTLVVGGVIRTRMAVQVKRWRRNVQTPVVQQMRGSLGAHEQGLIITTSEFSSGARTEADRSDRDSIALMNGDQLVALLVEHDLGVRRTSHNLIELEESDEQFE